MQAKHQNELWETVRAGATIKLAHILLRNNSGLVGIMRCKSSANLVESSGVERRKVREGEVKGRQEKLSKKG